MKRTLIAYLFHLDHFVSLNLVLDKKMDHVHFYDFAIRFPTLEKKALYNFHFHTLDKSTVMVHQISLYASPVNTWNLSKIKEIKDTDKIKEAHFIVQYNP